jgi:hypothetical protein
MKGRWRVLVWRRIEIALANAALGEPHVSSATATQDVFAHARTAILAIGTESSVADLV